MWVHQTKEIKTVYVNINDAEMKCWGETLLTTEMKQKWEYKLH